MSESIIDIMAKARPMLSVRCHMHIDKEYFRLVYGGRADTTELNKKHNAILRRISNGEDPRTICAEVWPDTGHDIEDDCCSECGRSYDE